eukprot:GEMP01021727.1.p1 GENE.GEMP01021727.1~~GEMP01021727.1.p1  ORF type:complete len:605 (+),score=168.58 GEMP01021727.1:75-1889(+)
MLRYSSQRFSSAVKMSASEAFVETLAAHNVKYCFGIAGSAFMDALDLFPLAGIKFILCQHEQNGVHMADAYSRLTGEVSMVCAQNGPGVTNFLTAVQGAYYNHSPILVCTPECSTMLQGFGGFQEAAQMTMFRESVRWQVNVSNGARIAELTARACDYAKNERGPTQLNIPRDHFYHVGEYSIPKPLLIEKSAGGPQSLRKAFEVLQQAKNPVVISGLGVNLSPNGYQLMKKFSDEFQIPVACSYNHPDTFPHSHPLSLGVVGYQGSRAAMEYIQQADVVIAVGSRLNPFLSNPQYGLDWWPKDAQVVQVDIDHRRLGLTKPIAAGVHGDAGQFLEVMLARKSEGLACQKNTKERLANMKKIKDAWTEELKVWTHEKLFDTPSEIKPREALAALQSALPPRAMVSQDIGNVCSTAASYVHFDEPMSFFSAGMWGSVGPAGGMAIGAKLAAPDRPAIAYVGDGAFAMNAMQEIVTNIREDIPVTYVVFKNRQWGAEKKNQVLWFGHRYIGTDFHWSPNWAQVARALGAEAITVDKAEDVAVAFKEAIRLQMEERKTCVLELVLNRELSDPFRRDAMMLPRRHLAKYKSTDVYEEPPHGHPANILA